MGTLYVVATPIGNLEDITLRALRILGSVTLIVAEDTRTTRKLLARYEIRVPLLSYDEHSAARRVPRILRQLETIDVALVSEAGVPGVSDPGPSLVRAAFAQGVSVVTVPGPSAVTAALAVAGRPADAFVFVGFPPRAKRERLALLRSLADEQRTLVLFEAPHRLQATLKDLLAALGDRELAVCREMTKLHEDIFRGSVAGAVEQFTDPRGEFVLVVAGADDSPSGQQLDLEEVRRELAALKAKGRSGRDAVAEVAAVHSISRRDAYRLWLELPGP